MFSPKKVPYVCRSARQQLLTQVLNLGNDARRRVALRPMPPVDVRDKAPDGSHILRLSHKRRRNKIHVVLDPIAAGEDKRGKRRIRGKVLPGPV